MSTRVIIQIIGYPGSGLSVWSNKLHELIPTACVVCVARIMQAVIDMFNREKIIYDQSLIKKFIMVRIADIMARIDQHIIFVGNGVICPTHNPDDYPVISGACKLWMDTDMIQCKRKIIQDNLLWIQKNSEKFIARTSIDDADSVSCILNNSLNPAHVISQWHNLYKQPMLIGGFVEILDIRLVQCVRQLLKL